MSQVINPKSPGKDRSQLISILLIALNKYTQSDVDDLEKKDLAAFVVLTLDMIVKTVTVTTTAWEKRGYWIKADRFRLEWMWIEKYWIELRSAVSEQDWYKTDLLLLELLEITSRKAEFPKRNRFGEPWHGAFEKLSNSR